MTYLWYWPAGGWDFDAWKARQMWQPIHGPQSGVSSLLPLAQPGQGVESVQRAQAEWLRIVRELLGTVTDEPSEKPCWEILETREMARYALHRVRYTLAKAEWGYAWLLLPYERNFPRSAVIALHQTVPQGKDEPVGLDGDPQLAYGKELAERGFIVFAPDAIGFGERLGSHPHARYRSADAFFTAHPAGSVLAKMVYDVQRGVDFLRQLPQVDSERIGCIGHSHGAYGTLFAMLFEPRIRAGVISCGFTTLRTDPRPERWWRGTALIPRLGCYEGAMEQTPLDFHHLLALAAPRPLMVVAGLRDAIFPNTDNIPQALLLARRIYRLYAAPKNLRRWVFDGSHCFPAAARARAYRMLEQTL